MKEGGEISLVLGSHVSMGPVEGGELTQWIGSREDKKTFGW